MPFRDKYLGTDTSNRREADDLLKQYVAGFIGDVGFRTAIARLVGMTPEEVGTLVYANVPNEPLFAFIRTFPTNIKIAMLSNAGENRLHDIFTPEQLAVFDTCALSSEIGFAKPDERAYGHVVALLEVMPEECVFVDDQPRFLEGARRVGMRAVLYKDFPRLKRELQALLADA